MREYILQIIAVSTIATIVCNLTNSFGVNGKLIRILTGIMIAIVVLFPFKSFSFSGISRYFDAISAEADIYIDEGKSKSQFNKSEIIKEKTEAYILDKANDMGLDIVVEVELNEEDSVPCGLKISGNIAPYYRGILCQYIEQYLGISKEYQQWI